MIFLRCFQNLLGLIFFGMAFFVLQPSLPTSAQSIMWDPLAEGLAIGIWKPSDTCLDVGPIIVADIDPLRYRFTVHYDRNGSPEGPPDINEWQTKTGHLLLFNAGLFRENFAYLGLLYGKGKSLGGRRHTTWMGLFVAEPTTVGRQQAGILDLSVDEFDESQPPYEEAAQSLMLLDRSGKVRVRQSGKRAHQTIVAENTQGHILVFKTTEPTPLYEIGMCLRDSYPNVRQAMAMDGGSSSDMTVNASLRKNFKSDSRAPRWVSLLNLGPSGHLPLPAVIGISAR